MESWNERHKRPQEGIYAFAPDFQDAPLRQIFQVAGKLNRNGSIPLAGVDLAHANLAKADLTLADLTDASLWEAKLVGTDLRFATLTGANLTASEIWKAVLYPPITRSPEQYADFTEPVKSIEDLLTCVQKLKTQYDTAITLYFRGECECGWELRPSVMRDRLVQFESEMLVDLVSRRPEELSGQTSALAQWVLAQHHGLKTRFLDITKNPLVALFHACGKTGQDEGHKSDGRIHVFAVPRAMVKPFNSDVISIIANVAKLSRRQQDALAGKRYGIFEDRFRSEIDYPESMRFLCQLIRQEKPYFEERIDQRDLYRVFVVEPQQFSERIRAQSGAFLVSAFHKRFEREEILKVNDGIPVYAHYRLTIPEDCKEEIIDGLRVLNITRDSLFPGLDSSAKAVTDSHDALLDDFPPPRWSIPPP